MTAGRDIDTPLGGGRRRVERATMFCFFLGFMGVSVDCVLVYDDSLNGYRRIVVHSHTGQTLFAEGSMGTFSTLFFYLFKMVCGFFYGVHL